MVGYGTGQGFFQLDFFRQPEAPAATGNDGRLHNFPANWRYSFPRVLKQCGQVVENFPEFIPLVMVSILLGSPTSGTGTRFRCAAPDLRYRSPLSQDGIVHPGGIEDLYHGLRDFLVASVICSSASHPEQVFHRLLHIPYFGNLQPLGPFSHGL